MRILIFLLVLWSAYWIYHYFETSKKSEAMLQKTITETTEKEPSKKTQFIKDIEVVTNNIDSGKQAPPMTTSEYHTGSSWVTESQELDKLIAQDPSAGMRRVQEDIKNAKTVNDVVKRLTFLMYHRDRIKDLADFNKEVLLNPPKMATEELQHNLQRAVFPLYLASEFNNDSALTTTLDVFNSVRDQDEQITMANMLLHRYPGQRDQLKAQLEQKIGKPLFREAPPAPSESSQ
jgi:hypothetical protein